MPPLPPPRILVSGSGGFLGRALVAHWRNQSAQLITVRSRDWDLRERAQCRRLLAETQPHVVVHLAAVVGGIGANAANPGRFFYDNAVMGIELIEAARLAGIGKFVAVGTICAYPKHTAVPFREDDLWQGYPEETNAPYGLAKKMMLVQLQAYRAQYGFNGIYLLPVNLYGPGDNFDLEASHVIPAMIRKYCAAVDEGRSVVTLWGSGEVTREFLYVDDCARGIAQAVAAYDRTEPVNLGSGAEIRVRDLAELIARLTGYRGDTLWDRSRPDGQPRRALDTSRATAAFGFRATTPLEVGLERTIAWWRLHRASPAAAGAGAATG